MSLELIILASKINKAEIKHINDDEYLVVPATIIKEGILNNIFYPFEQISNFFQNWNGVPVCVNHPTKDGNPVSANTIESDSTVNVGRLYNVTPGDDKTLKGDIWVNVKKAIGLGFDNVVDTLKKGVSMDVSTGLFSNILSETGTYNDTKYEKKIFDIRPDHLALLPNKKGACSIEDGCGVFINDKCQCDKCKGLKSNEETMDKKKLIELIVNSKFNQYEESDSDSLEKLSKPMLEKMIINEKDNDNDNDNDEDDDKKEEMKNNAQEQEQPQPKEQDSVQGHTLSTEDFALFHKLKNNELKRMAKIKQEVADFYEHLDFKLVDNMDEETIDALHRGVKKEDEELSADYSGLAPRNNSKEEKKYVPKGVFTVLESQAKERRRNG